MLRRMRCISSTRRMAGACLIEFREVLGLLHRGSCETVMRIGALGDMRVVPLTATGGLSATSPTLRMIQRACSGERQDAGGEVRFALV